MNIVLTLIFLIISTLASATDYFISSSGNDTNNGLSSSTSWNTIAKVNSTFSNLKPGDRILFNRGDIFYGSLVISKSGTSGSPIVIGAYGTGNNPVISGFNKLTSWTSSGNGIYYATLDVPRLNIVTLNGAVKGMGRYPNDGYLSYESHNAKLSITDNQLTGTVNWTGAEIGIRKYRWIIDRHIVTNHTNGTLTYSSNNDNGNATFYEPLNANGYFFQNHIGCLDDLGDWYYNDSENRIYMNFGGGVPFNYVVQVGNSDRNLTVNSNSFVDFANIDFEGANLNGVYLVGCNHIDFESCNFISQGGNAIYAIQSNYITLTRGSITDALNNGIYFEYQVDNTTIDGLDIENTGNILGASKSGDAAAIGLYINGNNTTIRNCKVSKTGYCGISFNGNNALIENNIVNTFCMVKDDGAGIYTYKSDSAIIRNNIVLNSIGSYAGAGWSYWEPFGKSAGIYLDNGDSIHNAKVSGNTIAHGEWAGIFINNNGGNNISNNTVFDFAQQLFILESLVGTIRKTTITGNQLIARTSIQKAIYNQMYINESPSLFGTINNNYYARPIDDNLTIQTSIDGNTLTYRTLNEWKSYSGQDANSHKSPVAVTDTSDIVFHHNGTNANKIIPLSHPMIDVKGTKYINSITLLPFTSAVLIVDPTAASPVYISAAAGNTTPSLIEMTYSMSLSNIIPATSAFTVLVNSVARSVNSVAISGTKVQLTLASAIAFGDVVTVAYTKPAVSPLQTTSAGQAASVSAQAVTNNVNSPSPVYVSSVIGNTTPAILEMTYNLSLANIVPAASAFTVQVNSAARAVNTVAISETKVQLTLASAIAFGDVVTVTYTKPSANPIQTSSAAMAVSVSAQAITNNVNSPSPVYVSSIIGNTTPAVLEMTYDLTLANIVPAASAFTILVNSAARAVNTVSISGTKVQLTLASQVLYGDVVTVTYTKPSANPIQTSSAAMAVSVSAQAVTNNESAPVPVYVSAAVGDAAPSQIDMTYNLSLANIVPAASAFTVQVNSAARAVNSVTISGTKVQLTLASQVLYGDVVTVTYTKPSANPIQTSSAAMAVSVSAQPVTNNVSAPVPVYVSATVGDTTPSLLEMTYNMSLANIVPAASAFKVLVNSVARLVNSVAISGTKVQLTLASAIAFGDVVTVAYTKPVVNPLQTTSAGQAASVSSQPVTNNVSAPVPLYVSAAVGNTTPSLVEMTYNLSLANIVPATSAFTVLVNSAARTVNAVAISGNKVQLTLASAIAFGDVVTVAYTKPALSPLQTSSVGQAASVNSQAVTNNVSAPVPVYVSATVGDTTPSLLEMTYNMSLANIVPAASAFKVLVNSVARLVNSVAISGTKVQLTLASAIAFGDVVTVAYSKPAVCPLQTTLAGQAASVSAQAVTNNVNAPSPGYVSSAVENASPSLLEMTYNLSLANTVPAVSAFSVLVNSLARMFNYVTISGTKVQLMLASPVAYGDIVTVAYTKPSSNQIQTTSAGQAASFNAETVTNNCLKTVGKNDLPDPLVDTKKKKIRIYPNPAHDFFIISFDDPIVEPQNLKIMDLSGKIVLTDIIEQGIKNIQIPLNFKSGNYIVALESYNKIYFTQKLIIHQLL